MSVLLTAGKKAVKPKSAKKKHRPKPSSNGPPLSSHKTAVWHWIQDGVPTVLMYTRTTGEVWCNGNVLENVTAFAEGDSNGGAVRFCVMVDSENVHYAEIRRSIVEGHLNLELFVDEFLILEYLGQPPEQSVVPVSSVNYQGVRPFQSTNGLPGYRETPPSYFEATHRK